MPVFEYDFNDDSFIRARAFFLCIAAGDAQATCRRAGEFAVAITDTGLSGVACGPGQDYPDYRCGSPVTFDTLRDAVFAADGLGPIATEWGRKLARENSSHSPRVMVGCLWQHWHDDDVETVNTYAPLDEAWDIYMTAWEQAVERGGLLFDDWASR